jgi:hypothetical protein
MTSSIAIRGQNDARQNDRSVRDSPKAKAAGG